MSVAARRSEPLRALLVDDEEPALAELRYRLEELGEQMELESASTSVEALRLLHQRTYDVLFLDIQMPGLNGLELAATLRGFAQPPAIVFVTAYDEYAVRAFELRATDYLMKPVEPQRLRQTIDRIRQQSEPESRSSVEQQITRLERLPVEAAGRTILIDLSDIRYAEARDDLVYVKTADQLYPTRFSLQELERRLPSPPFLRVHRAFLVNLKSVIEIRPYFNGAYLLRTNDVDRSELTVSRGHVKSVRSLLGL